MLTFVIRGLKVLAVLCTLLLLYLIYLSVTDRYAWRDHWIGMVVMQVAVLLLRRAARLLEQGKRSGAMLGVLCVLIGPTPMLFTSSYPPLRWFWLTLLGLPLIVVWLQLPKRPMSVLERVPEAQ